MAFADLAARGAEIAVIEVGLGGRLDSTNVVRPVASVVTKIEMDHQKYLGETLEAIAREKAWIAKPGAPFVLGETRRPILDVLRAEAELSVRSLDPGAVADIREVPAEALYQDELALLGAPSEAQCRRGERGSRGPAGRVPARRSRHPARIRARDGPRAARAARQVAVRRGPQSRRRGGLCRAIEEIDPPRPVHALVSILGDKAWPEMLVQLDRVVDRGILTVTPSAEGRRWDLEWLRRWLQDPNRPPARAAWRLEPDFPSALAEMQQGAGTVLVTGSFHTVGDVMESLGLSPI